MNPGQWICSVVEIEGTCYIRWVFVESWEVYRDALAVWFPGETWEPSHHRIWFHVGHLKGLRERVKTYIKTLLGSSGEWLGDYYKCNEIIQADTLRPKLFQELHAIVLNEVQADESGESLNAPHAYTSQCRLAYQYAKVEDTEVYDPEALLETIREAPLELSVEPTGCLHDPWDTEFPIVWKQETLKDLLVLAKRLNLSSRARVKIVGAEVPEEASFWKIDDCFNLRSRSMKTVVNERDLIALYERMGLNPSQMDEMREITGGTGGAGVASSTGGSWEDYFALPLGSVHDPMQPIEGYDRSAGVYFDFKHWTKGEDWLGEWKGLGVPPKKLAEEPAPVRDASAATAAAPAVEWPLKPVRVMQSVRLYRNNITGAVHTKIGAPVYLLPEITTLYESPEYNEFEAEWLQKAFDSAPHTKQPMSLQKSLYEMQLAALGVDSGTCGMKWGPFGRDQGNVRIGCAPVPELTARSVIQHVIQHAKLAPVSVWTPSQELLEVFMNCIKKINDKYPDLHLQCQRNVLSVLLADLVPKRRFMSGQMFQLRKPTVAEIESALEALPDIKHISVG